MMFVGSASALVTVTQVASTAGPLNIGQSFTVDIGLGWDGTATEGLTGIFVSHQWDNAQLQLQSAVFPLNTSFETRPVPLKGGSYDPQLSRLGTIAAGLAGDDLTSTARTIQYGQGAAMPLNPASANAGQVITRLTFLIVGAGDGTAEIGAFFNVADAIIGDVASFGPDAVVAIVPEPGTALLMGLGLAGLAAAGRRNA
jgi:hypothetical protein